MSPVYFIYRMEKCARFKYDGMDFLLNGISNPQDKQNAWNHKKKCAVQKMKKEVKGRSVLIL